MVVSESHLVGVHFVDVNTGVCFPHNTQFPLSITADGGNVRKARWCRWDPFNELSNYQKPDELIEGVIKRNLVGTS